MPMSRERKLGIVATIAGIAVALLTIAASAKGSMDKTYLRREEYRADQITDSAWKVEQRDMTLDVLCSPNVDPQNRRCR